MNNLLLLVFALLNNNIFSFVFSKKPVFITGASSKLGQKVVQKLDNHNISTICLVRNYSAITMLEKKTVHTQFVQGDPIKDPDILEHIMKGCSHSINLHGVIKPTKISNYFKNIYDIDHPYYVNYLSMENIIDSCINNEIKKIIRVTGLATAFPAYHPIPLIFDTLYSSNVHWHRMAEKKIIDSGLDFTIIRPGGFRETFYDKIEISKNIIKPPALINYEKLADLIVSAAFPNKIALENYICEDKMFYEKNIIACRGVKA